MCPYIIVYFLNLPFGNKLVRDLYCRSLPGFKEIFPRHYAFLNLLTLPISAVRFLTYKFTMQLQLHIENPAIQVLLSFFYNQRFSIVSGAFNPIRIYHGELFLLLKLTL